MPIHIGPICITAIPMISQSHRHSKALLLPLQVMQRQRLHRGLASLGEAGYIHRKHRHEVETLYKQEK
jgi:hypothetical protein